MKQLLYNNPRLLALFVGLILVAGITSFNVLPRLEDPVLVSRWATVTTLFPGATPERVESLVTETLEQEIQEVEEVKLVRSTSRTGISTITIELQDDVDETGEVWSRLRNKIDDAKAEFPVGAQEPEFDTQDVKAYSLIVALRWTLRDEPNYAVLRRRAKELRDVLRAIPGTEKVDLFGDPDEEIVVEIRPDVPAALGVTATQVASQLRASDAKVSAGQWRGNQENLLLEVEGELDSLARVGQTPIRSAAGGRFVRLADIAEIRKGVKEPPSHLAVIEGAPAVVVGACVRADDRIDSWTLKASDRLADFRRSLPDGVDLQVVFRQNDYVESRLDGLLANLVLGAVGVAVVSLLLMGWRSAMVISAALPLAALMVITGLRLLNIPIQQMSVTGLVIALGLLIDNAIVMVDDVRERLSESSDRTEAAVQSVRHLAAPPTWLDAHHSVGIRAAGFTSRRHRRVRRSDCNQRHPGDLQFALPCLNDHPSIDGHASQAQYAIVALVGERSFQPGRSRLVSPIARLGVCSTNSRHRRWRATACCRFLLFRLPTGTILPTVGSRSMSHRIGASSPQFARRNVGDGGSGPKLGAGTRRDCGSRLVCR